MVTERLPKYKAMPKPHNRFGGTKGDCREGASIERAIGERLRFVVVDVRGCCWVSCSGGVCCRFTCRDCFQDVIVMSIVVDLHVEVSFEIDGW